MKNKKVVIVGGGFAGINAAQTLGKHANIDVVIIDQKNHHLFQPLLYQVATAHLNPADIAIPIRGILWPYKNIHTMMDTVTQVDFASKSVRLTNGQLSYDYLILACGATHSYFGHPEWEAHAPGLKSLEDAIEIRRRVLTAFEMAEQESDPVKQKEWLRFVIIGGGPTGVELAGALGELSRHTLKREFRQVDTSLAEIVLIEAGPRILPSFPEDLALRARTDLEKLGVQVMLSNPVTAIDEHTVQLGSKTVIAKNIVWAAGVKAADINDTLAPKNLRDRLGRMPVQADLRLAEHPDVFVIGDQAHVEDKGVALPQVAPAAIQEGRHAARNIVRLIKGESTTPFRYLDKGSMSVIGRGSAIALAGKIHATGFIAWLMWCFVHILYLVGFRNRLLVLIQWTWSYFRFKRGPRIITAKSWGPNK